MLAESFEWNEDGTELTVKIRAGVTWNDGKPFTADDVVYSFTNDTAKPVYLKDAVAQDESTVVFSFDEPAYANEFAILGGTYIVPKHVFSEHEKDSGEDAEGNALTGLVAWDNAESPVGTGPYMLDTASNAAYTAKANPNYWGRRAQGRVAAVRRHRPEPVGRGPPHHRPDRLDHDVRARPPTASPPRAASATSTLPSTRWCSTRARARTWAARAPRPTSPSGRRSTPPSTAPRSPRRRSSGLAKPISPTFALLGRDDKWIADGMPKESPQTADAAAAGKILEDAGYTKDADGFYGKDGKPIDLTLTSVDGWSDFNNAAKLIEEQAKAAGIKVTASTISWNEFADARVSGEFELIMGGVVGTSLADPFQIYREWFTGDYTQKVGTALEPGGVEHLPVRQRRGQRRRGRRVPDQRRGRQEGGLRHGPGAHRRGPAVHPDRRERHADVLQHDEVHRLAHGGRHVHVPAVVAGPVVRRDPRQARRRQ